MTDEQWRALVAKWSDPKNMETCDKNKQNDDKVKFHQAMGSRSYVTRLHAYKEKRNNAQHSTEQTEELDALEAFKTCHTSSKHGLSELAREAVDNMESLMAQPVGEGETLTSSVQAVSKVLSLNSRNNTFLKNVGIKTANPSKPSSSTESMLREELATERQTSAVLQADLDELKKKSEETEENLARTQKELEETKKLTEKNNQAMEENNALLRHILALNRGNST